MAFAKISQAAYYVPSQVVTNDDLSKIMDTSDEWIASRTGIKERRISQTEDTGDLASRVAEQLLQKAALKAEEIDFIIVATITPNSMMPSTAARVQAAIGAVNAFAFDLTAACSGFVFALSTAEKLIKSGQYQKGLVIGAEVLSKTIDWTDRTTAVLFGDGAGGVLLEADASEHFLAESIHSDGSRGDGLTSGYHNISSPFSQEAEEDSYYLKMDGRAIFDFAIRDVSKSISALIEQSGFSVDDIDCFLLHQANIRILDKMAKKIDADREKFPANMMSYGNTSAASIPILLAECIENGTITLDGSQTVLLSGFGGGLTWGSLIVKI
ncbi:beta-ketoacyl-ACP synthase III [Streptococcus caviae]|uniref:beta-ketoacyl-ACP synthase III n=1 Tax=Streptococcus sp. 'caviae' TaxID=1915004 RepID=UPI00094BAF5B|nr:beta-ketoacyl-ACP synthase III [Streptococcus sp. 'caviae']OLN83457.1 3-oxoacyl-ACP synthase [Streptococcus sp. 'caviae']